MNKNRFKQLMESTLGDVKPLISEQGEPQMDPTTTGSTGTDPKINLVRETMRIISKVTPITDKETEKNIYYVLKVLFGVKPFDTKGLDERMKKYDYEIKKNNLYNYLPSSELIVKLKEIQ